VLAIGAQFNALKILSMEVQVMTPAVKNAVFVLDLEETRRHLRRALASVKKPSAQPEENLKIGMDQLAGSPGSIADAADRSSESKENA
jgi:ribosomal protein S2